MAESQPDQLSQFLDLDDKSVVKHNRCVDNCKSQTKSDLSKVVSGSPALCRRVENSWIRNKESLELMLASAAAPARCSLLYLQALLVSIVSALCWRLGGKPGSYGLEMIRSTSSLEEK